MAENNLTAGTVSESTPAKKSGKSDKKKDKKKTGSRVLKYFRDLKGEFKKITWPTLSSVVRNTLVTLAMCAFVGVVVSLVDFGLGALVNWMLSL